MQLQTLHSNVQEKEVIKKELEAKLLNNYTNKSIEVKTLKSEIETWKQDKNVLSVLSNSKQETKEKSYAFEKNNKVIEQKKRGSECIQRKQN